ncbi:alpha/beta hydrolase [Shewanella cyperi]|uniref:Alpha/beta hydrolase n=1 Tax=Shewanella cyperi TaxID=2814292 RepID=A0A974XJ90_9GAMM|nr:alpha/beta hydrolase [Shewanella cyperi]QSX29309.1 alpha/beta hydrolase [Shewanella cyperi]
MTFRWLSLLLVFPLSALATPAMVKIKGYEVEYEISGQGEHTIFLEAGGSAGMSDWDPVYQQLTQHAKVIRYSRIGNGNSAKLRKNYSSEEYAEEAMLLLDTLKIKEPVVYMAHSYGAYIARTFAATYPQKIAALMLVEPASEHDVDIMREIDLAKAQKEIAQVQMDDLQNGMSNQYLDFWAKRPLPDSPQIPDIPVTVIASIKKYDNPPVLFFSDAGREKWGKLHSDWAKAFPQGKAVLTDKSYHYTQFEEPELVVAEAAALLGRIKR